MVCRSVTRRTTRQSTSTGVSFKHGRGFRRCRDSCMFNVFIGVAAAPTKHTDFTAARLQTQGSPLCMLLPSISPVSILFNRCHSFGVCIFGVSLRGCLLWLLHVCECSVMPCDGIFQGICDETGVLMIFKNREPISVRNRANLPKIR